MTQQGYEPVVNGCFSMHDFPVRIRLIVAFGLVLLLGACGKMTLVSRSTAVDELRAERRGAVTLLATEVTGGCVNSSVVIGRKDPEGYAGVQEVPAIPLRRHFYVSLEEGEYHIVEFTCVRLGYPGNTHLVLGREEKRRNRIPIYKESYARFNVTAGEVVNLGLMEFYIRDNKIYNLRIVDMPKFVHEGLGKRYPKMYSNMITRLITLKYAKSG